MEQLKNKLFEFEEMELLRYLEMKLSNTKSSIKIIDSPLEAIDLKIDVNYIIKDIYDIMYNAKFINVRDELNKIFREFLMLKTGIDCLIINN